MKFSIRGRVPFGSGLCAIALSAVTSAQFGARDPMAFVQAAEGHFGSGAGSVTLPTPSKLGMLVGVFVEEKEQKRYTLEAELTSFVPGLFDPYHRVAFGGVYGRLREVAPGGALGHAEPELVGRVEGLWRMERDMTGEYEVLVYRDEALGSALAGAIRGVFHVAALDGVRPDPQKNALAAHPVGGGKAAKSSAFGTPSPSKIHRARGLGDARSAGASAAGVGDARSSIFGDAARKRPGLDDARSNASSKKSARLDDARGQASSSSKKARSASGVLGSARPLAKKATNPGYGSAGDAGSDLAAQPIGEFRARMKLIE